MGLNLFLFKIKISDFMSWPKKENKDEEDKRGKDFESFLTSMSKPKICENCPNVKYAKRGGYDNPCKKGHEQRMGLESCVDHPDQKYQPRK